MARGIVVGTEMFLWLVERLSGENYGHEERFKARVWLLKGDWRFKKGDVRLEYADFWPTLDQLTDILSAHNVVIISREEYRSQLNKRYEEGRRDGHSKAWSSRLPDNEQTMKFNIKTAQQLLEAKTEILTLQEKLADSNKQLERIRDAKGR